MKHTHLPFLAQRLFLILITVAPFWTAAQKAPLRGYIKGLGRQPVVFIYQQKGSEHRDTVYATQDRFIYQPQPSDDGRIEVLINYPRWTRFWYEPGPVTLSGFIEKPYQLTIKGGAENNTLTEYRQSVEWPYEERLKNQPDSVQTALDEQQRRAIIAFIKRHPASRTSADLLYSQTIQYGAFLDTYRGLLKGLSTEVQNSPQGRQVAQWIKILENQPVVGRKAPLFTIPDTAGHPVTLDSYGGKYVLLDFWGHWCKPCIRSLPKLKTLHEKYASQLVLIGVAAEFADDKAKWQAAIRNHALNWVQLSELQGDESPVSNQYNITAFPTYFLLDRNGVVIERANSIETIEQKLTALNDL